MINKSKELAYHRLNIVLTREALWKLDQIKKKAGLVSRGRTIQELIEGFWELKFDVKSLMEKFDANLENPSKIPMSIYPNLISLVVIFAKLGLLDMPPNET